MNATTDATRRREPFGSRFELFADMLGIGLATTLACLPLVTAPAAMSAACAQLRFRAAGGTASSGRGYARHLIARLGGPRGRADLLAGAVTILVAAMIGTDLLLVGAGLPGAGVVTTLLIAVTTLLVTTGLRTVALTESERSWRLAFATALRLTTSDPTGSVLLLLAVVTATLSTWILPVVAILVLGPLALAGTAVEARRLTRTR